MKATQSEDSRRLANGKRDLSVGHRLLIYKVIRSTMDGWVGVRTGKGTTLFYITILLD